MMYRYIVILGIFFSFALGQGVLEKENEYLQLQATKQLAEQQLDSLNQSLEETLNWIDMEKSENNDEDKIVVFMSIALSITKEIDFKESQIEALNVRIVKLEKELNTIYAKEMANLEKQLDSNITKDEKDELEQQLMILAEKRISVVPLFQKFSFNPERINQINLANVTDELEREISLDYLRSALSQVKSNIKIITEKKEEFEDTQRLEEKAELFMNDVTESQVLGFYKSSKTDAMAEATDRTYTWNGLLEDESEWTYVQKNAMANTIDFLSQLEYMGMLSDDRINQYKFTSDSPVTTEEYLEILKSSHDFLNLYRTMLQKKIAGK